MHRETPVDTTQRDGEPPVGPAPPQQWPPRIPRTHAPWWMRIRDLVLTIAVWLAYLWILRKPIVIVIGWFSPGLEAFLRKKIDIAFTVDLRPYVWIAAVLVAWLVLSGVLRRRDLSRQVDAEHNVPPLPPEQHFAIAGVLVSKLPVWRESRCLRVHFDEGRITSVTVTPSS
ncbi:PgaD family protein [Variovorax sp. J22P240]|uniref:PgaD family protein n=1 Tax=Variovorax sp. J22P240 TaxID=3053514 RepID=UPI00257558E1|nr:PgaD family protein [Variovorax sp. J22P240]MDL9997509.1 PgaD family protein [Variovorax sp. J22P240]